MKFRSWHFAAIALITLLAISVSLTAQESSASAPRYLLKDLGSLGEFSSWIFVGPPSFRVLNQRGTVVFAADTNNNDPYHPCFTDCTVNHAVRWDNGTLTDLHSIPGHHASSAPFSISENGEFVVGLSEDGSYDPLTGFPEYHAVLWQNGKAIQDLGTLGGSVSTAVSVNNLGQVVGGATNAIADQNAEGIGPCWSLNCWPAATQWRAYSWQQGVMTDLGTLGTGNDAVAGLVNGNGQVAGVAYTNTTANPKTGIPTQDPFFWEQGSSMVDIGTLGGTLGYPNAMNDHGEVVGQSNLAGDRKYHPFLWKKGKNIKDLGTLGGSSGMATSINDAGEIVGGAWTTGDQAFHAVLWRNGNRRDLGVVKGFTHSYATSINSKSQVVGCLTTRPAKCRHSFLWQHGKMYNLNKLIPPGSGIRLAMPAAINDRGEIAVWGDFQDGFTHAVLLVPDTKK